MTMTIRVIAASLAETLDGVGAAMFGAAGKLLAGSLCTADAPAERPESKSRFSRAKSLRKSAALW
jgi:hypothetical protein